MSVCDLLNVVCGVALRTLLLNYANLLYVLYCVSIRNTMYTDVYITCTCIHLIYSSLSSHACLPVHASMPHTDMCCHTCAHLMYTLTA